MLDTQKGKFRSQSVLNTTARREVTRHVQILPDNRGVIPGPPTLGPRHHQSGELFKRLRTCVTLALLTPKNRANAARDANLPLSNNALYFSANRMRSRFGFLAVNSARIWSKIEFHLNISMCGNRRNLLVRKAPSSTNPRFGLRPPRGAFQLSDRSFIG